MVLEEIRQFEQNGKPVRVSFLDASVFVIRIVSTMHAEEGGDVVAEVIQTVQGPEWKAGGMMNFHLKDVLAVEKEP